MARELEEEWLSMGPQAPEPLPGEHLRKRAVRKTAASAPEPAAKKEKRAVLKDDVPETARRQSSRLLEANTPPVKQRTVTGVDPSPQSSSASSRSSTPPKKSAPEASSGLPGSSARPSLKRARVTPPPATYALSSMLDDSE